MENLQDIIKYRFDNIDLLTRALTHSSYASEHGGKAVCNERLEYLGDAVVEIIISEYLFNNEPDMNEGDMTRLRALIVCEGSLAAAAREISLGEYLLFGHGEATHGGHDKDSILADAFEALIGAIFADGGFERARDTCLYLLDKRIMHACLDTHIKDHKSSLQEVVQKHSPKPITYEVCKEVGPAHDKLFGVNAVWEKRVLGYGEGKSKKEAEQNAAYKALENWR